MSTPQQSDSDDAESTELAEDFNAAAINDTRRRTSTTRDPALLSTSATNQSDQEPDPAPGTSRPSTNTRPRTRKQRAPLSRLAKLANEIRRLQMSTNFMIPRLSFGRVVRELMNKHGHNLRITLEALEAVQTATELYMTQRFEDAYLLTLHRGRVTLELRDLALMGFISGQFGRL